MDRLRKCRAGSEDAGRICRELKEELAQFERLVLHLQRLQRLRRELGLFVSLLTCAADMRVSSEEFSK